MRVYLASVAGIVCLVAGAGAVAGRVVAPGAPGEYLFALAGLAAAVTLAFVLVRGVMGEIGRLLRTTQESIKGNLICTAGTFRRPDLEELKTGLNRMELRMIEYLRTIKMNTAVLEETGAQVTAVAEQVSQASQNQAGMVQEMLGGIEKLAVQARDAAQGAEQAASAALESDLAAGQGEQAVEALIRGIHSVSARIESLREMSSRIEQIVETVSGIAGETNLLALNAAVEAARAGELGRGFAVVADEVGRLAEGAAVAASLIRKTVNGIETATGRTVETVETSGQLAGDVGKSFAGIRDLAGRNAATAGELARACHEQAAATGGMVSMVERITEITEEAMATAEETTANLQELTALSERFKKVLVIFTYDEAGGNEV
ncbi:MAG: methyl-accepting chemotaxis protein [Peptococcaceae bacterium]|nr:methyl-accepting chemotaxis protein [Peptococcaceae bacterium]